VVAQSLRGAVTYTELSLHCPVSSYFAGDRNLVASVGRSPDMPHALFKEIEKSYQRCSLKRWVCV
jgi:hypothetical protein